MAPGTVSKCEIRAGDNNYIPKFPSDTREARERVERNGTGEEDPFVSRLKRGGTSTRQRRVVLRAGKHPARIGVPRERTCRDYAMCVLETAGVGGRGRHECHGRWRHGHVPV